MSLEPRFDEFRLNLVDWANQTTDPNVSATVSPVGSILFRNGSYPTRPTEIYLKTSSAAGVWTKENLVNLNVYNVQAFGATGDGATDDTAAIQAAINAAVAAGGGLIYFPATPNAYRVVKIGLQSFNLNNVHDLTFFGDGQASTISMIANAALGEWHMFTLRNGTTRIKFLNLAFLGSGITNPDPANQAHFIQINGVAGDPNGGARDIEVTGCYFGQIKGAGIRNLAESGEEVFNIRVHYNMFDMVAARSNIEAQRYSYRVQFKFNWCTGTASGNVVDFEPTGGTGLGTAGPQDWKVIGNGCDNGNQNVDTITCGGAGSADPARRCQFLYNILTNGGGIQGGNCVQMEIAANVVTVTNTVASEGIVDLSRLTDYTTIHGNVLACLNNTGSRVGFRSLDSAGVDPVLINVSDNVFSIMNSGASQIGCIDMESGTELIASGNVITMDSTVNIVTTGVLMRAQAQDLNHGIATGNMVLATTNTASHTVQFSASPNNVKNTSAVGNYANNTFSGIRWDRAAAQTFTRWRACCGNSIVGATSATIEYPITNVGLTMEGSAAPGTQFASLNLAAGPGGNVTAPIGSACTNIAGVAATVLWIKETGTGTAGWVQDGDVEVVFGVVDVGTATAARFLAPGLGLAAVSTVEIKIPIPRPGTLRNFRLTCTAGTGGGTNTYVVRKNGANQSMAVAILNTATTGLDASHPFTVAAGDLISIQVTKSVAPVTGQTNVTIMMGLSS